MPWRPCLKNWFDVGCSKKCYRYLYFYRSALPQNSQRQLNLPTSPFQTEIVQMTPILQRPSFPEVFNCLLKAWYFDMLLKIGHILIGFLAPRSIFQTRKSKETQAWQRDAFRDPRQGGSFWLGEAPQWNGPPQWPSSKRLWRTILLNLKRSSHESQAGANDAMKAWTHCLATEKNFSRRQGRQVILK